MPIPETLRSILETPAVYLAYQSLVGGVRARKICIRDYVRHAPGSVVVDIGCGPGYTTRWLPQSEYYGFDICEPYIAYARRKFGQAATFQCELFTTETAAALPPVDVVLMMGLLHHLDDTECLELLRLAKSTLRPGGRVITLDGCYRQGQSPIARYLLDSDRGKYVRKVEGYERLAKKVFPEVAPAIREDLFFIPYTCVVLTCG
jgi:SAM-dependent methyltransferase